MRMQEAKLLKTAALYTKWETETGDQRRRWMGADQNFSRNRSVGLYPKNHHKPSNLERESSYGSAISLRKALGSYAEAKESIRFKSQNSTAWTGLTGRGLNRSRPVWPVLSSGLTGATQRNPWTRLQKRNLEQTKSKSSETWRIPPQLTCEHIPKRSFPKDQRNLRI